MWWWRFCREQTFQVKTVFAAEIVFDHHPANKLVGERLSETIAREHKGIGVDDFTSVSVEVAWDTRSMKGAQGGALDPATRGLGEILKSGQMRDLQVKLVDPSGESVLCGAWKFLNGRIIRGGLKTRAAWSAFLDGPRGTCAGDDL